MHRSAEPVGALGLEELQLGWSNATHLGSASAEPRACHPGHHLLSLCLARRADGGFLAMYLRKNKETLVRLVKKRNP